MVDSTLQGVVLNAARVREVGVQRGADFNAPLWLCLKMAEGVLGVIRQKYDLEKGRLSHEELEPVGQLGCHLWTPIDSAEMCLSGDHDSKSVVLAYDTPRCGVVIKVECGISRLPAESLWEPVSVVVSEFTSVHGKYFYRPLPGLPCCYELFTEKGERVDAVYLVR